MYVSTPVITSAMGGQPGTLMIGLSVINWLIGLAPVGFGLAACTQPLEAQEPHATIALASLAVSFRMFRNESPPTVQYTPPSLVGALPSTARRYWPLYFFITSRRISSTWKPAAACSVSS